MNLPDNDNVKQNSNLTNNENKDKDEKPIVSQIISKIEGNKPELFEGVQNKEALAEEFLNILTQEVEVRQEYEEHHQGPLPSPTTLQGYNEVITNGAERIMVVFEKQSSHRMTLEEKVIGRQTFQSLFGQILGFLIAITCLIFGLILVLRGFNTAGITLFSLDLVGLAYVFVVGKRQQKKSLSKKK